MLVRVFTAAVLVQALAACGDDGSSVDGGSTDTGSAAGHAAVVGTSASDSPDGESGDVGSSEGDSADGELGDGLFPDVVAVEIQSNGDGTYRIDATLSSPYDSGQRYADAWRVLAPDGTVLGILELAHDHAGEQPFTRSLAEVEIDPSIDEVTVEGRDQLNGWGGATVTVAVPQP